MLIAIKAYNLSVYQKIIRGYPSLNATHDSY